jgi:hypothetical protein
MNIHDNVIIRLSDRPGFPPTVTIRTAGRGLELYDEGELLAHIAGEEKTIADARRNLEVLRAALDVVRAEA